MVAAALLSVSAPPKARAANVFWDVNGPTVGAGGAGAWDTSSLFWFDAGSGKTITGLDTTAAYTFTAADTAYFTGAGGAVTMSNDITIGGLVFNAKGYSLGTGKTITLDGTNATPVIVADTGVLGDLAANSTTIGSTLAGTAGFIKQGGGNLILTASNPSLSGTIKIDAGVLEVGAVADSLGTASVQLNAGSTLSILSSGARLIANNVVIAGPATINTGADGANSNGIARGVSGTLTLANTTLNFNNANRSGQGNTTGDDPVLNGTITLQGIESTIFQSQTNNNIDGGLNGKITGPGTLTITGGNGGLAIGSSANDYSGGTYLYKSWSGPSSTTAVLGTGPIVYGPGQTPYLRSAANIGSASSFSVLSSLNNVSNYSQSPTTGVQVHTISGYSGMFMPNDFAIGTSLNAAMSGAYGTSLQLMTGWTNAIDMSKVGSHAAGNAPWFLGAQSTQTYSAASLVADNGVYRIGAGNAQLTFNQANVLTGSANVVVGNPLARPLGWLTWSSMLGFVDLTAAQNYSGTTTINQGSLLRLGANVASLTPNTALNLSGTLDLNGAYTQGTPQVASTTLNVFNTRFSSFTMTGSDGTSTKGTNTGTNMVFTTALGAVGVQIGSTIVGQGVAPGTWITNTVSSGSLSMSSNGIALVNNQKFSVTYGGILLDNRDVVAASADIRLPNTAVLNLSSGNFKFLGSTSAVTTTQNLATINVEGGNLLEIGRGNATTNNAKLTVGNLARVNNGVITISALNAFTSSNFSATAASDTVFLPTNINGSAAAASNGMVAPWIIDLSGTTPTFVNFGAGFGLAPIAAYSIPAGNVTSVGTWTATSTVDVTTGGALAANASALALRIGNVAITGTNTITVGASAAGTDPAGVIFAPTANQTQANLWVFGTSGAREAMLYTSGFTTTLSGTINATGLTKAGPGTLYLSGANTGAGATSLLSGAVTVNQGTLQLTNPSNIGTRANPTAPYTVDKATLVLAGGNVDTAGASVNSNLVNFLNNVTVLNDSAFTNGPSAGASRFGSLTFAARQGGSPDPTMLSVSQGLVFTGTTTLNQATWFKPQTATSGVNSVVLEGAVSGSGALEKFGDGALALVSGASTMSGAITVHQGILASLNVRAGSDTPFGTSSITVNPGAGLHLSSGNVGSGLTVTSDQTGLAIIGLGYVGAVPTFTANYANTGSPYSAVIAIDAVGYNLNIDQSTLGGGKTFLGGLWNSNDGSGVTKVSSGNFIGTITPGTTTAAGSGFGTAPAGDTYRLGGGATNGSSTGVFSLNRANILTGANNVVFGAVTTAVQASSTTMQGGGGTIYLNAANDYSGFTTFNAGQTVQVGHNSAFGTSTLIFNNGTIGGDAYNRSQGFVDGRRIGNAIKFSGDINFNSTFNGQPTDLTFTGDVGLTNDAVGGSLRNINVGTSSYTQNNGTMVTFSGVISDGDGTYNSLSKLGAGTLRLQGTNTYTGITMVTAGNIAITSSANLGANPLVRMNGGTLSAWEQDLTLTKT
jgi:fibronectin-binding autotransporter adhesin